MEPKQMKIDEGGYLWIERATKMKKQICPYDTQSHTFTYCGDWCPLFVDSNIMPNGQSDLGLCRREYFDVEIQDERI